MSLKGRTDLIISSLWVTTSGSTGTFERAYQEAYDGFGEVLAALRQVDARIHESRGRVGAGRSALHPGPVAGLGVGNCW